MNNYIDIGASNRFAVTYTFGEVEEVEHFADIEINADNLINIFSSNYKIYNKEPVGKVTLKNLTGETYKGAKLSYFIKEYMDFPSEFKVDLTPRSSIEKPVTIDFNNLILNLIEDANIQMQVTLTYNIGDKQNKISQTFPLHIHSRNSLIWDELVKVGAFITPKDLPVNDFARYVVQSHYTPALDYIPGNIAKAMLIYECLKTIGIKYIIDPNNPYSEKDKAIIDTIQFPRKTLRIRSGDCDDLVVLYASLFENLGIKTILIDAPGHIFMGFKIYNKPGEETGQNLFDPSTVITYKDEKYLLLETTVTEHTSFIDSIMKAAVQFNEWNKDGKLKIVSAKNSWRKYKPATLKHTDWAAEIPSSEELKINIEPNFHFFDKKLLGEKGIVLLEKLRENPHDAVLNNKLGILYIKKGMLMKAINAFKKSIEENSFYAAPHNNLGNIYYELGQHDKAIAEYKTALAIKKKPDLHIHLNLSIIYYLKGLIAKSKQEFEKAYKIDENFVNEYFDKYETLLKSIK